jgi:hypothetical protein
MDIDYFRNIQCTKPPKKPPLLLTLILAREKLPLEELVLFFFRTKTTGKNLWKPEKNQPVGPSFQTKPCEFQSLFQRQGFQGTESFFCISSIAWESAEFTT